MRLQKKAVVIDGFQMTATRMTYTSTYGWPRWVLDAMEKPKYTVGSLFHDADAGWIVMTLEGSLKVSAGDWILRGVQGELYPCKPDIQKLTYDVLGPDEDGT